MRTKLDFRSGGWKWGIIWCKYVYNNIIYTAAGGRENACVYIYIYWLIIRRASSRETGREVFVFKSSPSAWKDFRVREVELQRCQMASGKTRFYPSSGCRSGGNMAREYAAGAGRIARVEFTGFKNRTSSSDLT